MEFSKTLKQVEKQIAKKEKQLDELKIKLKEKWPEDCYGVKWMIKYDEQAPKLNEELKKLNKQRDIAWQYAAMMEKGSIRLDD